MTEIGIFISFVNTLGEAKEKAYKTDKDSLSIWTWNISGILNDGELQKKRPLSLSCTYNRSSGELSSKEIDLPFWSVRMGCTDSTFSNWLLNDILRLFWWIWKRFSETGLLRVALILLSVFPTFFLCLDLFLLFYLNFWRGRKLSGFW